MSDEKEMQRMIEEAAKAFVETEIAPDLSRSEGYRNAEAFAKEITEILDASVGIDTMQEVTLAYYLYFPTEADAKEAATMLETSGLTCEVDQSDEEWLCYVKERTLPHLEPLCKTGEALLASVSAFNGELDGWELLPDEGDLFAVTDDEMCQQAARDIVENIKKMYGTSSRFIPAVWEKFPFLDRARYDRKQRELEALGFVWVADMENETLSRAGEVQTLMRLMYHPKMRTYAYVYEVVQMQTCFIEFDTMLEEGTMVMTTNAIIADDGWRIESIDALFADMPINELWAEHARRLSLYASEAVADGSAETYIAYFNEGMARKFEVLKQNGWISRKRLLQLSGGDEMLSECIYKEIQNLAE